MIDPLLSRRRPARNGEAFVEIASSDDTDFSAAKLMTTTFDWKAFVNGYQPTSLISGLITIAALLSHSHPVRLKSKSRWLVPVCILSLVELTILALKSNDKPQKYEQIVTRNPRAHPT